MATIKVKKLQHGESLEIGDIIQSKSFVGIFQMKVSRVTKTKAVCKRSDGIEISYKRQVGINMSYPNESWSAIDYICFRPIGENQ